MKKNLIFLSGPHGSGKTTLGKTLASGDSRIMIPELYSRNVKFNIGDEPYRQALKIASRAIENFEYLKVAGENPDKIVLGNRCVYDVLAYNWIYYMKNWIPAEVYKRYDQYAADSFRKENSNPLAIVVNPDFGAIKRHLEKRWAEKGKKWREEDLEYAELAHKAFERFSDPRLENVLYIGCELKLGDNSAFEFVRDWINEKTGAKNWDEEVARVKWQRNLKSNQCFG